MTRTSAFECPNIDTNASEQKIVFLLPARDAPFNTTKLRSERKREGWNPLLLLPRKGEISKKYVSLFHYRLRPYRPQIIESVDRIGKAFCNARAHREEAGGSSSHVFARLRYLDTRTSGPEQVRNGMLPGESRETLCPQPYVTPKPSL